MLKKILFGIVLVAIMVPLGAADNGDKQKEKAEHLNNIKQKTKLLIKFEISQDKGKQVFSPKIVTLDGQEAKIRLVSAEYFPVSWKAPVFPEPDSKNAKSVPAVPVFDKPTDIGISISITPVIVKRPGKSEVVFAYGKITLVNSSKFEKITYSGIKYVGMLHSINSNTTSFMLYFVDTNEQEISFKAGDSLYKAKIYCKKLENK